MQNNKLPSPDNGALSRLFAAAVTDRKFRELLLSDPAQALAIGYKGETFHLTPEDREIVRSIQEAASLSHLAEQLLAKQKGNGHVNGHANGDTNGRVNGHNGHKTETRLRIARPTPALRLRLSKSSVSTGNSQRRRSGQA